MKNISREDNLSLIHISVVYDRVLRFEERDKLMKILYYVYLLDVYMAVANVAKERGFVFAKAHPNDKNTLVMKGMFHPFLTKPVGNTITVDELSLIHIFSFSQPFLSTTSCWMSGIIA